MPAHPHDGSGHPAMTRESTPIFRKILSRDDTAEMWLTSLGVRDAKRGCRDLRDLASRVTTDEVLESLLTSLDGLLDQCPDPGMALTNLDRFTSASPDPSHELTELARDRSRLGVAISLFSTSQHFSEQMIRDPSLLDWLRGRVARRDLDTLIADLWNALSTTEDDAAARLAIRRHHHREMLRIGYNDIVRGLPLEVTILDLSHLADSCVEASVRLARRHAVERHGEPRDSGGKTVGFVVLALGKLGGAELNYSSDIDLIFLYDDDGMTDGPRPLSNAEFFARMGGEIVRLLADHTPMRQAYRVDIRLRPEGDQGPLARSLRSTIEYYETSGRTWERQALIKCRPIAGDLELGRRFVELIDPFVYRRYLSVAEISEIKAMKRRIERRAIQTQSDGLEVKTGRGGIRDVEFVVQFLQLLHGGTYREVRHSSTLIGLQRLEAVGCLTLEERDIMEGTYRFLRKVEHRLQTMFDLQTHLMPTDPEALRSLAVRMGYPPASAWEDRTGPAERFLADYRAKTEWNRKILNHLLHDAFRDEGEAAEADPAVDLILDPLASPERVASALAAYPFRDRAAAYQNLLALAHEDFEFLSQARCRHFFAAVVGRLLQEVALAPDPDLALANLEKVSASLGAKAILWELFNFNPASLNLYVRLCAGSPFLSEILINNPGMIDDLMDSLVIDQAQSGAAIRAELSALCKGAEDLGPILLSFRNKEWIRIGARDILGREPIRDVTRELADVAEAIISQVARDDWERQTKRHGIPRLADGRRAGWAVLGLGSLGGRELNYHSDIDLVFVHEGDGWAEGPSGKVSNEQFFNELVRSIFKALNDHTERGVLYSVDMRLRPHGSSGPLVIPLEAFRSYYQDVSRTWERLALTRARVVHASGEFGKVVTDAIREQLCVPVDPELFRHEAVSMRKRLEESRGKRDLKRGSGGQADIEFIVQFLQWIHATPQAPEVLKTNVWDALNALWKAGILSKTAYQELRACYDFQRGLESRLRMLHNRSAADLPEEAVDRLRLARGLHYDQTDPAEAVAALQNDILTHAQQTRSWFDRLLRVEQGSSWNQKPNENAENRTL
jgi:glutamate-ammonia-ligase adenylyltransferase